MNLSFITNNLNTISVILFYTAIIVLLILNRKKFEIQSGFIAIKRTKIGLRLIRGIGKKHKELIKILGYIGIGVGFIGMIFVSYIMLKNLYTVFTVPGAQSEISPALPGIRFPGSPINIPLIIGWIALFIVVLVHEFSHGIVATAHGLKVKSSGIAFFGPIMGAFVEPDEKKLSESPDVVQYSVYAAGPFSNMLLSIVALLLISLILSPVVNTITQPVGFSFDGLAKGMPAQNAGINPGMVFITVNGNAVVNDSLFIETMQNSLPNEIITLETEAQEYDITLAPNPDDSNKGYIGVNGIRTEYRLKPSYSNLGIPYWLLQKISELFWWVFVLSSGIGIINLLPLGPIDGGRMLQVSLVKTRGKKQGMGIWTKVSIFFLAILLLNIFMPLILSVISKMS